MFRIRRIHDDVSASNREAIREVRLIFAQHFSAAPPGEIEDLTDKLRNPFRQRFRVILYVAEDGRSRVRGFGIALHEPVLQFCYLDYLATGPGVSGRGIGAAVYETIREEAVKLQAQGLFLECAPDEPQTCFDPKLRRANASRLKFYERYDARPIAGTAYQTPVPGGSTDGLPFLVYDPLDRYRPLSADFARQATRAILERKYASLCPPAYIQTVVDSFRDDPVRLREPRYTSPSTPAAPRHAPLDRVVMTINDRHDIHHIRERGYVESPVRIAAIENELRRAQLVDIIPVQEFPLEHILAVHDAALVTYLELACAAAPVGKSIYPYVFPIRNPERPPRDLSVQAGYYCIDTFTPVNRNAWPAAKRAVDAALTAAQALTQGHRLAYALVRPPGHHAERRCFGGFCYFNNAAVAAHWLSQRGRVAILDIDFHHGNGQQDIFYDRHDVLTISLHGDPSFAYPYFTGFSEECGTGAGAGFNLNIPLPEVLEGSAFVEALNVALARIREFAPAHLVVALGLDPAKGDPTGTWLLGPRDFAENGRLIRELGLPTLVVQEGGYRTRSLGVNARRFLEGLAGLHDRYPPVTRDADPRHPAH